MSSLQPPSDLTRRAESNAPATTSQDPGSKSSKPKASISRNRRLLILALHYVVSPTEYASLRRGLAKCPNKVIAKIPSSREFDAIAASADSDDFLPASSRAGIRVFALFQLLLNGWGYVSARLRSRKNNTPPPALRSIFANHDNFMSSLSLSTFVVFHRLLYRFFHQLRLNLQLPQAKTFRIKYPRAAKLFLSRRSPSAAASLAGFSLLLHPASDRRVTISVYTFIKALEFAYNRFEDKGYFQSRPWWFGSWLFFPLTSGQLFYSFVFYRDCFPKEYTDFINNYSKEYIQPRPAKHPMHLPWPAPYDIVESLAKIADLRFPQFASPILFPDTQTLPKSLSLISPVISSAHPTIKSLQCALLHPDEPSCLKAYIHCWASELPRIAKFLTALYCLAWVPRYKKFAADPMAAIAKISTSAALTSMFVTGSIGTAWAFSCFLQRSLPRTLFPKGRFWVAGMMGGLWALADKDSGRANFLYSFRIGLVSAWKVLVKKGLVRPIKNGDVLLFVLALMSINYVYDRDAAAVSGGPVRRVLASLRGRGLRDLVAEKKDQELTKGKKKNEAEGGKVGAVV